MTSSLIGKAKEVVKECDSNTQTRFPPGVDLDDIIGYQPRSLQKWMDDNERRFNVEVLHRRFGKTVRSIRKLMHHAVMCPFDQGRYAYIAPTYSQAEDIAWAYLYEWTLQILARLGLPEKEYVHKGKLAVWLPTYDGSVSRIRLYGVDSPKQRIRGLYLDGVVMDEYAWVPPSVWPEQIRPMLMDDVRHGKDELGRPNQWADFIFTPVGRNHAYTLYRKADMWYRGEPVIEQNPETGKDEETFSDEWFACRFGASDTHILNRAELANAYNEMGRSKYEQEMEVSFDAALEGTIYAHELEFLRDQGRIQTVPYNPMLPVETGWDLGWDDATAIWFAQLQGEELRVIDYYEASGAPLSHFADVLAAKGYRYGKHYFPHDVEVHELGTGKSRASVLRELGIRVTTVPKHYTVDRIAATQAMLPRCRFDHTRCAEGLDRLALYRREWDEKRGVMRENPLHDWASHAADGFGILTMGVKTRMVPQDWSRNVIAELE